MPLTKAIPVLFAGFSVLFAGMAAAADRTPDAGALVEILRKGGCYIVMRHASSPRTPPAPGAEAHGNTTRERQLDAQGIKTARAMGDALRRLRIPIGEVLSSPTWRAQETAQEAKLPTPRLVQELGDGGQSMSAADNAQTAWLRQLVTRRIQNGNTVVITHFPNLQAAFPQYAADLADGEAMILKTGTNGDVQLLRRVHIEEWPNLGVSTPR
jgi:phosphohistidine phosphatase SixA